MCRRRTYRRSLLRVHADKHRLLAHERWGGARWWRCPSGGSGVQAPRGACLGGAGHMRVTHLAPLQQVGADVRRAGRVVSLARPTVGSKKDPPHPHPREQVCPLLRCSGAAPPAKPPHHATQQPELTFEVLGAKGVSDIL